MTSDLERSRLAFFTIRSRGWGRGVGRPGCGGGLVGLGSAMSERIMIINIYSYTMLVFCPCSS